MQTHHITIKALAAILLLSCGFVSAQDKEKEKDMDKDKEPELFKIEECLTIALGDPRWVKANKANERHLRNFNSMLEKQGVYEKNPLDYKQHYANWSKNQDQTDKPNRYASITAAST